MNEISKLSATRIVQYILLFYPISLLTIKGSMSASLIALVILSIYLIVTDKNKLYKAVADRDLMLFIFSMSAVFVSVVISQLIHLDGNARHFDSPARFLFSIPIYFVLRTMSIKVLGVLQYSFAAGAIVIGMIIFMTGQKMTAESYFLIHIHLGNLALMLGFLSVFSINWTHKDSRLLLILKVFGLISGLYVSLVSGARGGWAAIPVFFFIWIFTSNKFRGSPMIKITYAVFIMLILGIFSYFVSNVVQLRIDAAISDLRSVDPDTSLGVRFQLWGAATHIFMQNPIFGAGSDGFGLAMNNLSESGVITKNAAEIGKGEVHSYYFATLARFGSLGILSLIFLFVAPLFMFLNALKSQYNFHRVASRMGLVFVLGFVIFCITVEMFNLKMIATFYGVTLAILLAAATNRTITDTADS